MSERATPDTGLAMSTLLRSWRERVSPQELGLVATRNRQTPGLRREELAILTGLSTEYVARLEQGRSLSPSRPVVTALARVLQLSDTERAHLFRLAGHVPPNPQVVSRIVPVSVERLVDQIAANPVGIYSAAWDLLTWNELWEDVIGNLSVEPGRPRNLIWRRFTGLPTRVTHEDEERYDANLVGSLRSTAAAYPQDDELQSMVAELIRSSDRFREAWERWVIAPHPPEMRRLDHPDLGTLFFDVDILTTERNDLRMVVFSASRDSETASRLDGLRHGPR